MHDADGSVRRLNGHRERHLAQRIAPTRIRARGDRTQPAIGRITRPLERVLQPTERSILVVPERDRGEPALNPVERLV